MLFDFFFLSATRFSLQNHQERETNCIFMSNIYPIFSSLLYHNNDTSKLFITFLFLNITDIARKKSKNEKSRKRSSVCSFAVANYTTSELASTAYNAIIKIIVCCHIYIRVLTYE